MIKDVGGKFDDYSISPRIVILLRKKIFFLFSIKMSYWFNREEVLQEAKKKVQQLWW